MSKNDNSMEKILSEVNFKMGKKLGEGMFSTVKLATHSLTNEQVAIKILEKTKITKIEDKERIKREIEIMKKVKHYNIARLYAVIDAKYSIYLIQEYVQGKELLEYINKKGKLTENEACKFFHQIISALDYIHQCGIAHRDFKPENIIVTNNNQILKIIDFGLGNTYEKGQLLKTACGSPCYVPPEMIKEEKYNGALSDIWSAGIILYLMLCGKLPFYDDDNQILYEKILAGKYEEPEHLSEKAKDLLKKIIEIDVCKRINFEGIKSDPWFSIINKNYLMHKGINIEEEIIPIDEEILQQMEKLGINNKVEIRYNILKNYYNKITTIYYLLLKQKMDNNKKSISDLNSDLYDEYINNKRNKIGLYINLENAIKNRIGDDQKKVENIPNWPENKYEGNADNLIKGDSGSVIERLIKAGKFEFDEENMCISKVKSTNFNLKDNKDGEKFKTISSMKDGKFKKLSGTIGNFDSPQMKTKKGKVHFQINTEENEKVKPYYSPNPQAKKKEKKEEDEDWYKEMEEQIDKENLTKSGGLLNAKKKKKIIKEDNYYSEKPNKKSEKNIASLFQLEDEEDEDIKENKIFSSQSSKNKFNNKIVKKSKSKFSNTNDEEKKLLFNKNKSTREIKKSTKVQELHKNKSMGANTFKTAKANKTIKVEKKPDDPKLKNGKKRDNSESKKEEGSKRVDKFKKINVDNDEDMGEPRRNQSATKRKPKLGI